VSRILILYGTTDGHTGKIARYLAAQLRTAGAEADVAEPGAGNAPDPRPYAGVIVAASVHQGDYQRDVRSWVAAHSDALQGKPAAFLSVCLAVLQSDPEAQREIAAIAERFLSRAHWRPAVTKLVAGALLYTRYNWLTRWAMRRIVGKAGGATDTSRDYEYTDWNDLTAFAQSFLRLAAELARA
jgi:menaquinone-dependent protoporphyrinogen oxidase